MLLNKTLIFFYLDLTEKLLLLQLLLQGNLQSVTDLLQVEMAIMD